MFGSQFSINLSTFCSPFFQVIDNSGALLIECVNVLKQKVNNGWGSVGDEIVCVVKRARPVSAATQASATAIKVRRGDVRRAVIVRTKKAVRRPDGRFIRFDDNAAVLLNNKREMLGTRIGSVVSADLRMKGWGKIVSLAPKVMISPHELPLRLLIPCVGHIKSSIFRGHHDSLPVVRQQVMSNAKK